MPGVAGSNALRVTVEQWAAVAGGLSTRQQWLEWFRAPTPLEQAFTPQLPWMAAGLRRRLTPMGRAALGMLAECQPQAPCPVVFASRYGDLGAVATLLAQLHREGGISPMTFSLSVHNSAVGIYSIARQERTPTTSITVAQDLAESAFLECLGWLADGAPQVVMVCCDDVVPAPYGVADDVRGLRHAWACRLALADGDGITLETRHGEPDAPPPPGVMPPALGALAFLAREEEFASVSPSGRYLWRRHA